MHGEASNADRLRQGANGKRGKGATDADPFGKNREAEDEVRFAKFLKRIGVRGSFYFGVIFSREWRANR